MLTVGEKFPQFRVKAATGATNDDIKEFTNASFQGKWKVFFFYPKDFTFVCPTEIVEFDKARKDFESRNAVLIGGSADNEFCHLAWRREHAELRKIQIPLIAAPKLAGELGILDAGESVCLRATFIVDPQDVIQWVCVNNLSVGRSVAEPLRVLDAIQCGELCPCNWQKGQPTLKV